MLCGIVLTLHHKHITLSITLLSHTINRPLDITFYYTYEQVFTSRCITFTYVPPNAISTILLLFIIHMNKCSPLVVLLFIICMNARSPRLLNALSDILLNSVKRVLSVTSI